ncbi:38K [Trabala vishnou gigantina nucleopolyhedrovirus]|uniref:38K n=1 Tax=Trabala vishnou gigantina nucleopolyhedrovirus TaxID=2863583 RepID=UPI002481B57F|nr:38K [Trabala vishnou gigantina nucleopolyhedrovirus]QYC92720.1 38K [Trabala vishnou gigantina nucleopolyhedrovirus]
MFEYVLFAFDKRDYGTVDLDTYIMHVFKCKDDMKLVRHNIKTIFKTCALGHTYVINERIPMYSLLHEWYVQNYLEIYQIRQETFTWETPHVIVFDLDSTLVTDELEVRIRDECVHFSLMELKERGCVLVLWSYGNEEHVSHSLETTKLAGLFDVVICEGHKTGGLPRNRVIVDNDFVFIKKPFYLDIEDGERLPKSPRVVLYYLRKIGVNFVRSLTLVDDLECNNYSYDFFVKVKKCREPRNDWQTYHDIVLDNIEQHDKLCAT